jgi:hypothetical protein
LNRTTAAQQPYASTPTFDNFNLTLKINILNSFPEKLVIMDPPTAIKIFEEKWYFSVIDTIEILTGTDRPRKYWSDLKAKLKKEGSELSDKIGQMKMQSADGKFL